MKIKTEKSALPISVICEGKIVKDNLNIARIDEVEIANLLKQGGAKNVKNVLVMTIDKNGNVFFQKYNQKYQVLQTKPLGKVTE